MPEAMSVLVRGTDSEEFEVKGWCSPRLCTQPTAFHHCAGSLVT